MARTVLAITAVWCGAHGHVGTELLAAAELSNKMGPNPELAVGFLEAFVSENGTSFVAECAAETGAAVGNLKTALKDFERAVKARELEDVSAALRSIAKVLDEAPEELEDCKAGAENARDTASQVAELVKGGKLFSEIEAHLLADHDFITSELDAGIAALAGPAPKNLDAGTHFGRASRHLLLGRAPALAAAPPSNATRERMLLEGFLAGFVSKSVDQREASKCAKDVDAKLAGLEGPISDMMAAVRALDFGALRASFKRFADAFHELPAVKVECETTDEDVMATRQALADLRSEGLRKELEAILEHATADRAQLMADLATAEMFWKIKDYVRCGEHVGQVFRHLVLGWATTTPKAAIVV